MTLRSWFTASQVEEMRREHDLTRRRYEERRDQFIGRRFRTEQGREFAHHGFARRLGTMMRAIDLVFELLPPESQGFPERDALEDATIALQSFVMNVFGGFDNLAWMIASECEFLNSEGYPLRREQLGFSPKHKQFRASLSPEFLDYIDGRSTWFEEMRDIRDSLAHRIPLYIPPFCVIESGIEEYNLLSRKAADAVDKGDWDEYWQAREQQTVFHTFRPWIGRSVSEGRRPIVFHAQLIADFATLWEFSGEALAELDRQSP